MATTQNRTFFGGSTAPGSGVYPEDVKILKVFKNYAETDYDPLAGSDTSVYIPTVEKVDSSGTSIQVTIQKILASSGYPVLVFNNEEYQYITTGGTPSKYVFMCLSDLSTLKRVEVDASTGAISSSSNTIAGVNYIGRSASNIYTRIANTFTQNRLPVIVDDSYYYQLSYAWNGVAKFTHVDEDDGSIHILSINSSNVITETVVQGAEILKITKAAPEASGLTVAEYDAISSAKMACLYYGSGSTTSYAYIQSYGNTTTFIHQTSTGYDVFSVAPSPTPVDPSDPDSELRHVVTKTSYTYGSSAMTMRNFEALDATDSVNTHSAFPLGNDEFWVMEDWDGGWNNPNYYVMVAPSDSDNNCVVRFENVTTSYFTSGYPIEIWNHSKNAQLTPLDGSLPVMKAGCSYEIRIYGDKYYCYETVSQGTGGTIYPSLQSAIADAANLSVGDIFETNGFHTNGDGGAARYLVSDTGTANGMDIVSMGGGKLAILQISNGTGTPEQFGYNRFNQDDLTPIMNRMQTAHIRNIVLSPLESGDSFPYLMKTTFTPNPAVRITSRFNYNTGAAGRIWFVPTTYGNNRTVMFQLTGRGFEIKDVILMNRSWFTESDKHNCVCFRMAVSGYNNMFYDFDSIAIQGFDIGFLHENVDGQDSSGLIWHCTWQKLQMALNNVNVYLKNVQYLTKFENCFFSVNDSGARSIVLEETFTTEFNRCNFGIYNPATTAIDFKDYLVPDKAVDRRFSQAKFTNCNFELESDASHPLPTSSKGFFMRFEDHDEFAVELDNCTFILTPLIRNDIYGCRPIQLGAKTRLKITNSSGPYADVNYSGNEFYGWDYCKRMFDETKPPMKEVGSLIIQHCVGIIPPPNNQWGSVYLPTVKTDEMTCPQSDDNTNFLENYTNAKDGTMLLNLDKANIETKIGNSLVQVTAPATGKVRIGDRIYDYVTIDGRKWITTNLRLWTMGTRQWHYPDHDDYGFYYQVQSFGEIDALLPAGWRRPTNTDFNSLISQGYAALQATGQTAFPSATNSSGFSALPSQRWKKPNTAHTFTNCFLWGTDNGNGYSALRITSTAVSIAGWSYSDINSVNDPVYVPMRVCCDA